MWRLWSVFTFSQPPIYPHLSQGRSALKREVALRCFLISYNVKLQYYPATAIAAATCIQYHNSILCTTKTNCNALLYFNLTEILVAMKDFLYHGESSVFQENLDSFLAIADELQLDGLKETQRERVPEENRSLATKTASTFAKDIGHEIG